MTDRTLTDTQAENLLSRHRVSDPGIDALADALIVVDLNRLEIDLEPGYGRYSLRAAAIARSVESPAEPGWLMRLSPRLAGIAMTVILLMGATGVAFAADSAAPGDLLYGLDRAIERIGLDGGGLDERLAEAGVMAERGMTTEALNHVADSLPSGSNQAADALHRAAENLVTRPENRGVETQVGEMLEWMATTDLQGRDFGQGVAERARDLGNQEGDPSTSPERGAGTEPGNGNTNPGGNGNGNGPPAGGPPGQAGK